jgi:hypothetical protein
VGCKGPTGIQQTVVLWKGDDSSDEQVKVCDMEFCVKHAIVLPFKDVYFIKCHKERVVDITPKFVQFGFCHTACRDSQ